MNRLIDRMMRFWRSVSGLTPDRGVMMGRFTVQRLYRVFGSILFTGSALIITLACLADCTPAAEAVAVFAGGAGTENNPFRIENIEQLQYVRHYPDRHFIIINDIDASSTGVMDGGKGFKPVGTYSLPFSGSINGGGKEISGLFINRPDEDEIGLFGYVGDGGTLSHIRLIDANVRGRDIAGALVGANDAGEVRYSYASGEVDGNDAVGGLAGANFNGGKIEHSHARATVNGEEAVGGLVGWNFKRALVSRSFFEGSVQGRQSTGGLVGMNEGGAAILNSLASARVLGVRFVGGLAGTSLNGAFVYSSRSAGAVKGEEAVGGLIGWNAANVTVKNSMSSASVEGEDATGGLVGWNFNRARVKNSYSTGNVNGVFTAGGLAGSNDRGTVRNSYALGGVTGRGFIGGLVGWNLNSGLIENSYSAGSVTGIHETGGLVGGNEEGIIMDSFYDIEVSGRSDDEGKGLPKSSAEMKVQGTFQNAGWDFTRVWRMEGSYPVLRIEPGP